MLARKAVSPDRVACSYIALPVVPIESGGQSPAWYTNQTSNDTFLKTNKTTAEWCWCSLLVQADGQPARPGGLEGLARMLNMGRQDVLEPLLDKFYQKG